MVYAPVCPIVSHQQCLMKSAVIKVLPPCELWLSGALTPGRYRALYHVEDDYTYYIKHYYTHSTCSAWELGWFICVCGSLSPVPRYHLPNPLWSGLLSCESSSSAGTLGEKEGPPVGQCSVWCGSGAVWFRLLVWHRGWYLLCCSDSRLILLFELFVFFFLWWPLACSLCLLPAIFVVWCLIIKNSFLR